MTTKVFSRQEGIVWEFKVSGNMLVNLNDNEASLFFNALEDSIEEICANYNVEPWELKDEEYSGA